tara:strand:+ start:13 stop:288 length:276 start_codon:yes stop_codon:yes gene_type:complete
MEILTMEKIYRGATSSNLTGDKEAKKEGKIYRGSSSVNEENSKSYDKGDLIYRGVSVDTSYYQLSKVRSSQRKRKLFHSGLEVFGSRKYSY